MGNSYLQDQVERDNVLAPITVALIATPIYSSPLLAMSQIGGMFQHGNSIGAAFSLLILGAGTNLGLLLWFGRTYGVKRVLLFFLLLLITTVGLAYVIDKPLYPKGIEPAGHSHAFDVYTNPFGQGQPGMYAVAVSKAGDFWKNNEFGGTYLLGGLILVGLVFRLVRKKVDLESWYQSGEEMKGYNRAVPGWVLGVTTVAGLVIASVSGCYLYYPAPGDIIPDMSIVNTECVLAARNGDWEAAEKWIGFSDDLSRRMEVGVFLRQGAVAEFPGAKAKVYRQKLDELKEYVDSRRSEGIRKKSQEVADAYLRMSKAFRELEL